MPTPVSITRSSNPRARRAGDVTVIRPPSGVNLMALDSRLLSICCTRAWSWCIGGRSGWICISRSMFFFSVSGRAMSHWAPITCSIAEVGQPDLHLAALDLGQVEDVVDHVQEHPARLLDVLHVALLFVVQRGDRAQHVAEAEDAVQRACAARGSWWPGSRS